MSMNIEAAASSPAARPPAALTTEEIDQHVGKRIRLRRKMIGVSQPELAKSIGITYQQVQKYELGRNRVATSTMWLICQRLRCSPLYFFEGLNAAEAAEGEPEDRELQAAIQDPRLRPVILKLKHLGRVAFDNISSTIELMQGAR